MAQKKGVVEGMKRCIAALSAVLIAAFLTGVPAVAEEQWVDYDNGRFGYSVQYPDIYTKEKKPDNGDGVWLSARGGYELTLSGGHNVLEETGEDIYAARLKEVSHLVSDANGCGEDWYRVVYSDDGGKGGKERYFYEFGRVNEESWASFVLVYPAKEKERFAEIAAVMEDTLRLTGDEDAYDDAGIRTESFTIEDGELLLDGEPIECEVYDVPDWLDNGIANWVVIGPDTSELVAEEETGVWFFNEDGYFMSFIPLDSDAEHPQIIWSPVGDRLALMRGGMRPDLFLEVYAEGMEKVAEFACLSGSAEWLEDGMRLVFTRIDDVREEARFPGRSYGFRFSVVLYDSALGMETVLKEATDKANYVLSGVSSDGEKVLITETSVKSPKDWKDETKIKEREIKVPVPAAG